MVETCSKTLAANKFLGFGVGGRRLPRCGPWIILWKSLPNQISIQLPKVGIRNFSPHLCNSTILQTKKSIVELRTKKSFRTAIVDLQNWTSAIPQLCSLRPVLLLSSPFSSAQNVFKNQPKIILNRLFLWKQQICLKGIVAWDFGLQFFFHESTPYGFLIHSLALGYHTLMNKFLRGIIPL